MRSTSDIIPLSVIWRRRLATANCAAMPWAASEAICLSVISFSPTGSMSRTSLRAAGGGRKPASRSRLRAQAIPPATLPCHLAHHGSALPGCFIFDTSGEFIMSDAPVPAGQHLSRSLFKVLRNGYGISGDSSFLNHGPNPLGVSEEFISGSGVGHRRSLSSCVYAPKRIGALDTCTRPKGADR